MGRQMAVAFYVAAMIAVIVGVDFPVLQNPVSGPAAGERWHRSRVRSFLFEICQVLNGPHSAALGG